MNPPKCATWTFILSSVFLNAAMAKDVDLKVCTTDHKTATLTAHIDDAALKQHPNLPKQLNDAFIETGRNKTSKRLLAPASGQEFLGKMLHIDIPIFSYVHFTADPRITPGCKP